MTSPHIKQWGTSWTLAVFKPLTSRQSTHSLVPTRLIKWPPWKGPCLLGIWSSLLQSTLWLSMEKTPILTRGRLFESWNWLWRHRRPAQLLSAVAECSIWNTSTFEWGSLLSSPIQWWSAFFAMKYLNFRSSHTIGNSICRWLFPTTRTRPMPDIYQQKKKRKRNPVIYEIM